jgi:diguanylate cyclase (GGDEF)-like protein
MILDALTREVNRAAHNDAALSVAVADIDLFKQINDTQGHAVGDVVLQTVARRIRSVLRDYDAIGRLGGEEFLLVMPACDRAEGRDIAERARSAITSTRITFATGEVAVTLSLGVSCSTPEARLDAASLVELADAALYRAKASGRNRVEM